MERTRWLDQESDELEIDLLQIFRELKKKLWAIILAALLLGGAAGAFSKYVLIPQYQSTTMVYIVSKETTLTSLADLQIGTQLTQDYKIIVTSRPVLQNVIDQLKLPLTYKELKDKIKIDNPSNTRILSITVQYWEPRVAKEIADAVARTSSEYIGDIMEMVPPKIIEEGVVPTEKSSPSNVKNAAIGGMIGIVLICGYIILKVILNDSIQTEEDVMKYLGISVLAAVPVRQSDLQETPDNGGSKRSRKRAKQKRKGGRS